MTTASNHLPPTPTLPRPLSLPLSLIPPVAHSTVLVGILNRILRQELADGELDFLEGQVMMVRVSDARISYHLTLYDGKLKAASSHQPYDLSIEGTVYDFLLLATRREDADTLFFNRRLRLGGSTELGLYVKNFLDALELEERMGPLLKLLNGTTSFLGRLTLLWCKADT